jgi:hypothetical protein
VLWILIQHLKVDPDSGGFDDHKLRKKTGKIFFFFFNLLIPKAPQRPSMLQEKPSARKRELAALPKMKFFTFFSIFVGHFCLQDPGTPENPDKAGSTW